MGGLNPAIQLAAALDRRGITVSVRQHDITVHIHRQEHMTIRPRTSGARTRGSGRDWSWTCAGLEGSHPAGDCEGTAEAVEAFLRGLPGLAGTELLYRMNHIGWTQEQEEQEALQRARKKNEPAMRRQPDRSPHADTPEPGPGHHSPPGPDRDSPERKRTGAVTSDHD